MASRLEVGIPSLNVIRNRYRKILLLKFSMALHSLESGTGERNPAICVPRPVTGDTNPALYTTSEDLFKSPTYTAACGSDYKIIRI